MNGLMSKNWWAKFYEIRPGCPNDENRKEGDKKWRIDIPGKYRIGHEAHFGQVTDKFLKYLVDGKLPEWEVPNMITKYYTTTEALKMAKKMSTQFLNS